MNSLFMPKLLIVSLLLVQMLPLMAQQNAVENKPFTLNQIVDPRVAKMAVPVVRPGVVGLRMPVSSPSKKARQHVLQGFSLVYAQWDFEAYRHFCAALVEDPDCLLAYCGVALSTVKPNGEYARCRNAAVTRMLDLIEMDDQRVKSGKAERYPKLEKQFTFAIANLVSNGAQTAGAMMKTIAKDYPNLIQAQLLGAYLTRGSYDLAGNASPQRKQAIEDMQILLQKYPENPLVLGFWLSLHAEAPGDLVPLRKDVLPYARKLAELCPDVPSWQHTLGHFEWRSGNFLLAQKAFTRAVALYEVWMNKERVSLHDCEGLIRAKCYLANTLYHRGDFLGAMKIAKEVRAIKLDSKRPMSEGNQILLWRAYTLPARLYMAHAAKGDMNRALKSLPEAKELEPFANHPKYPTLSGGYMDALKAYIGCRKALEMKDLPAAKQLHRKMFQGQVSNLAKVLQGAKKAPDFSHYYKAMASLAIYDSDLYGLISMHQKEVMVVTTANHFRSARDKQLVPSTMMPPLVITHMENRLGDFYMRIGQDKEAYGAYQDALNKYPNNMESLRGIKKYYSSTGQAKHAEQIQKHIDLISPKN